MKAVCDLSAGQALLGRFVVYMLVVWAQLFDVVQSFANE